MRCLRKLERDPEQKSSTRERFALAVRTFSRHGSDLESEAPSRSYPESSIFKTFGAHQRLSGLALRFGGRPVDENDPTRVQRLGPRTCSDYFRFSCPRSLESAELCRALRRVRRLYLSQQS